MVKAKGTADGLFSGQRGKRYDLTPRSRKSSLWTTGETKDRDSIHHSLMKTKEDMPEAVRKEYDEMLTFINESSLTQSLLYDLDLLPEQVAIGSRDFALMVTAVQHMKAATERAKAETKST